MPRRTLQRPRRNRLRIWPWTSARFCTRRIRNERLLLALFFLSATFGTRLGCTLVSARSSFQVRAWQTHARMHGSSQITHRFVLRFVNSATKYPRCARTRPVLSCHGFRPGPCPRSTLARGWMVWATFLYLLFVLHCVNHSHGTSPKKVPRGGGSCHISPARITFTPPKGQAYAASFAYLLWARSRTNSRHHNSNRAKSSALYNHADLINDEPSQAQRFGAQVQQLVPANALIAKALPIQTKRVVDGVAIQILGHDSLQPCPGSAMHSPPQRL